nr:gamma-glutamyltransferase [Paraburkholderia tuberum]
MALDGDIRGVDMLGLNIALKRSVLVACVSLSALSACGGHIDSPTQDAPTQLSAGAAATGDNFSAQVAQQILAAGGNAVDAAVATAFTLAVTYPEAGNIGGGGFMTIYMNGQPYFLDYREVAPAATSPTFFSQFSTADGKEDPQSSVQGAQAVGVPGTVMGLWTACQRFCKLPWQQLLAPAIALARNGYIPSQDSVDNYSGTIAADQGHPYPINLSEYFGGMKANQTFTQPDLAATLDRISSGGADEFYKGKTADLLVSSMTQDGGKGVISKADLASYKPVWRQPISFTWKGMTLLTAPPPSSGGVALAQLLGMKADLANTAFTGVPVNSVQYIHLSAEMMKRVFADRATYLGDPDFVSVPVAGLLDPDYIAQRAAEVNPTAISPSASVVPGKPKFHTTHFSIVDKWGNAVSNTYTLNGFFGSGVVVRGAGFVLNDEMDDFATVAGQPNALGVVGGDANAVQPGKRPLSSMSPSILLQNGKVAMVIGTPGGSHIFTSLYQVLSDVYDYNMPLADSVKNMRFHHQLPQGTVVYYEPYAPFPSSLVSELATRGYSVANSGFNTDVAAVQIVNGNPIPVSDPRGRGASVVAK